MSDTNQASNPTPVVVHTAVSSNSFINSLGVDTQLSWLDSSYFSSGVSVLSELQYIGFHNVRDGSDGNVQELEALMAAGIKFDLGGNEDLAAAIANLNTLEQADPGGIIAVEGVNESPVADLPTALASQQALYAAVMADPLLQDVQVYNYTIYSMQASAVTAMGNVSSSSTTANTHSYSGSSAPIYWNSWYVPQGYLSTPGLPEVVTETGYNTAAVPVDGESSEGVNQDVQAKYILDTIFDMFQMGIQTTYIYELMDNFADPTDTINEDNFGLFTANGTPKEAAVALHNLTTIIGDTGQNASSFTPTSLSYSIQGLDNNIDTSQLAADFGYGILSPGYIAANFPTYGNSMLLEKSDGTFDLAVWQEPEIWDVATSTEIQAATTPVVVTLAAPAASVEVYDPLIGTSPIETLIDVTQITVGVSDHPIIIEIDPFKNIVLQTGVSSINIQDSTSAILFGSLSIADPNEGETETVTVTLSSSVNGTLTDPNAETDGSTVVNGVWEDNGSASSVSDALNSLVFTPTQHEVAPGQSVVTTITTSITDTAGQTASSITTVTAVAVAAPISISQTTSQVITSNGMYVAPFENIGVIDPNASQDETAFVILSTATGGILIDPNAQTDGSVTQNGGLLLSGLAADVAKELSSLLFEPSAQTAVSTNETTINATLTIQDTAGQIASASTSIVSEPSFAVSSNLTTPVNPTIAPVSSYPVDIGSGPDTIALTISEDSYKGNARFVILVNGTQIGGTQTTTAQQGLGQSEVFDVEGTFNSGTNAVTVRFINDAYGGTANADRNLYLMGATYDGSASLASAVAAPSTEMAFLQGGAFNFTVNTPVPSATTIGSGPDQLQLTVAEQAFYGDAQFTINVDGKQIGGMQTATAIAIAGESQVFNVYGLFGAGNHNISLTLVNPYSFAGYPLAARSLYVEGASLDGTSGFISTANSSLDLTRGTGQSFSVSDTSATPVVLGSGPDTLALFIAEDFYLSDAQFNVTVDGQQIGGTQTADKLHGSGQTQEYDVQGTFAPGKHIVSVNFLNDAYGGSSSLDRNLYVDGASINGNTIAGSTYEIYDRHSLGLSFTTAAAAGSLVVGGAGSDTLALNISEDYYQGNAQFTVSVDGKQIGGTQTATAIHGNGQSQVFDVFGSFGGPHTAVVNFLNDAYDGSATQDRNLYVGGASVDGTMISNSNLTIMSQGAQSFTFTH